MLFDECAQSVLVIEYLNLNLIWNHPPTGGDASSGAFGNWDLEFILKGAY